MIDLARRHYYATRGPETRQAGFVSVGNPASGIAVRSMARFSRTKGVQSSASANLARHLGRSERSRVALRRQVRERGGELCEFCRIPESMTDAT
jgi:hypothetical protein